MSVRAVAMGAWTDLSYREQASYASNPGIEKDRNYALDKPMCKS